MTSETPPVTSLPTVDVLLNSSALKLTNCPRRYHNVVVRGLRPKELHEALMFGKAVHKYAEQRERGQESMSALSQALQTYEGTEPEKLTLTCINKPPAQYPAYTESSGRQYLELKFKVYWRSIVYAGSQYNIYVCGTLDHVVMFADGAVRIRDYKTSRKWKFADVFADYRVSVQMLFYAWAAYKFGHHIFDMAVANQTTRGNVFVQICGVFISANPPVWRDGPPIQASIPDLDDFEEMLVEHVENFILPAHLFPTQTGKLNDTCGGCEFVDACWAENETAERQAEEQFKVEKYDPTTW